MGMCRTDWVEKKLLGVGGTSKEHFSHILDSKKQAIIHFTLNTAHCLKSVATFDGVFSITYLQLKLYFKG